MTAGEGDLRLEYATGVDQAVLTSKRLAILNYQDMEMMNGP